MLKINVQTHMRERRKKGNVTEFPSGAQKQMRKKFLQLQEHVIAIYSEQDIEGWQYGLTRPN